MGWAWALYFCQAAMAKAVAAAVPMRDEKYGGLVRDGFPPPLVAPGAPIAAVYVDNAVVVAWSPSEASAALQRILQALDIAELAYHDVVEACSVIEFNSAPA